KPSSKSVPALRYYSEGLDLSRQGKYLEAVTKSEDSTQEDANFARAYPKLSEASAGVGQPNDAERASLKAVSVGDTLPAQEKYLVLATREGTPCDKQHTTQSDG